MSAEGLPVAPFSQGINYPGWLSGYLPLGCHTGPVGWTEAAPKELTDMLPEELRKDAV